MKVLANSCRGAVPELDQEHLRAAYDHLLQRDRLLVASAEATRILLSVDPLDSAVLQAMKLVGEALGTDRIGLMEHVRDATDRTLGWAQMRHEWVNSQTHSQLKHPDLSRISYEGVEDWYWRFCNGETLGMLTTDLPEPFRTTQVALGVYATYSVPILLDGSYWGFLAFDDCHARAFRSDSEIAVLKTAAASMGAAIERNRVRQREITSERATREAQIQRLSDLAEVNAALEVRDLLLAGAARAAQILLESSDLDAALQGALSSLGEAAGVSRLMLLRHIEKPTALTLGQVEVTHEWCAPSVQSQICDPEFRSVIYPSLDFYLAASSGEIWTAVLDEMPESFRETQAQLGVASLIAVPIFVNATYWGCIDFDECRWPRAWNSAEIAALRVAASVVGAALERQVNSEARAASELAFAAERELAAELRVSELAKANEALARSTARLACEPDLEVFLGSVLIETARQTGSLTNALFLYEPETHTLRMRLFAREEELLDISSDPALVLWQRPVPADLTPVWKRLETECPVQWVLGQEDPDMWDFSMPWHRAMGHAALVCVPLVAGDRVLGFMGLGFKESTGASPEGVKLAQALANQAVLALEIMRLTATLKDNEARLTLAHDAAEIGTWDWNLKTNEVIWSDRNFALWDKPRDGRSHTLSADVVLNAIDSKDQARVRAELQASVAEGKPFRSEFRVQGPDNRERWLAGLGCHLSQGESPGRMIGINMDVTSRRSAEVAAESEARAADLARANIALQRSIDRFASETEVSTFLRAVLEEVLTTTLASCTKVFRYAPDGRTVTMCDAALRGEGIVHREDARFSSWRLPMAADLSPAWSGHLGSGVCWFDNDHPTEDLWPEAINWNRLMGYRYIAVFGLQVGGRKLGFLSLSFTRDQVPDNARVEHCGTFAQQAALAIYLTELAEEGSRTAELNATVAERTRLAAEIHDGLQQLLLASQLWIGVLKSGEGTNKQTSSAIEHVEVLLQQAVLEARRTVKALRPSTLDDHDGLLAALNELGRHTSTDVLTCRVSAKGEVPLLTAMVQDQLYRIAQEAVCNASKHAGARSINIQIEVTDDKLRLMIDDDGVGASDAGLSKRGFGLANMRERAQSIKGDLSIRTAPGAGFEVSVLLQL